MQYSIAFLAAIAIAIAIAIGLMAIANALSITMKKLSGSTKNFFFILPLFAVSYCPYLTTICTYLSTTLAGNAARFTLCV